MYGWRLAALYFVSFNMFQPAIQMFFARIHTDMAARGGAAQYRNANVQIYANLARQSWFVYKEVFSWQLAFCIT